MGSTFVGSTSEEIVRRAGRPVLVVREQETASQGGREGRVLVPVDFSDHSRRAVSYGKALSEVYDAALDLAHVIEEPLPVGIYGMDTVDPVDVEAAEVHEEVIQQLREMVGRQDGRGGSKRMF